MEHIKHEDSQEFAKGPVVSHEYFFEAATLNIAPITIHDTYPEQGFAQNTMCDSIVHVISGQGTLETPEGVSLELNPGDQVHIKPGDHYRFKGVLKVLYAATPPWNPEQARIDV